MAFSVFRLDLDVIMLCLVSSQEKKPKSDILLSVGRLICFRRILFGGLLSFLFTVSANRSIAATEKVGDSVCTSAVWGALSD